MDPPRYLFKSFSICNPELVKDIEDCPSGDELTVITNGGSEISKQRATAKLLPIDVHFNPHSLANILSLRNVANIPNARLTMDTAVDHAILLHVNDEIIRFTECRDGLYYFDTNHNHSNPPLTQYPNDVTLLNMVQTNKQHYSTKEIKGADTARKIQASIGWPSTETFKTILTNNQLRNSNITADDISRAKRIYGPPPPLLMGKSTRSTPSKVNIHHTPLPLQIKERYVSVHLHIDFFYVNGLPFLHTKSEHLNFLTVQTGKTRNASNILHGLKTVINLYEKSGFQIKAIFGDN